MVTVAIAGATTGFGLTMLRVFLQQNDQHKHKIVILSRSQQPELAAQGVDVRPVDYTNHDQLVTALSGVHTLISTTGGSFEAIRDSQLALIRAAKESGVKRFAPSEYAGMGYENIDLYQSKLPVWEAAKASGMEVTRFSCGIFMSVFATGTPKPVTAVGTKEGAQTGEEEALAGLRPWNFIINMKAGTADLPVDGSSETVFTNMRDVALFIFRALDLEKWPQDIGMRGDVMSWKDAVEVVENVQQRKFLIKENSMAEMETKTDDAGKRFYNQVRVALAKGWGMVPNTLNEAFPDIRPITCKEFVEKWWAGVEIGEPSWGEDQAFM